MLAELSGQPNVFIASRLRFVDWLRSGDSGEVEPQSASGK
jgi:hypothetical protein